MQHIINLTQWFVYEWGKPVRQKPHQVNLKSPLLRIYYYQDKRLQVKGILVPNTNLQLNPYLNTQLDLQCSGNLSFQYMAQSTWLTNQCTDPSIWLSHQLEKDVGCKVFLFIHTMKIKKLLDHKILQRINVADSSRERWTEADCLQS